MRRRWGSKRIIDRCRLVQESLDRPALTTDVIVGFPGETDRDFADTLRVVREIGFSKIHIFHSARAVAHRPPRCPIKFRRPKKLSGWSNWPNGG